MIRQGWQVGLMTLMLFTAGCGSATNTTNWSAFPVTISAHSSVMARNGAVSDFQDAMTFWETKAGKKLFNYKGVWTGSDQPYTGTADSPTSVQGNVVFFQNPWTLSLNIAGKTTVYSNSGNITGAIVMINPEIPLCTGDCINDNVTSQRKDFTHELGHFLGLAHSTDVTNIMYPTLQAGGSLESVTIDTPTFQTLVQQ